MRTLGYWAGAIFQALVMLVTMAVYGVLAALFGA